MDWFCSSAGRQPHPFDKAQDGLNLLPRGAEAESPPLDSEHLPVWKGSIRTAGSWRGRGPFGLGSALFRARRGRDAGSTCRRGRARSRPRTWPPTCRGSRSCRWRSLGRRVISPRSGSARPSSTSPRSIDQPISINVSPGVVAIQCRPNLSTATSPISWSGRLPSRSITSRRARAPTHVARVGRGAKLGLAGQVGVRQFDLPARDGDIVHGLAFKLLGDADDLAAEDSPQHRQLVVRRAP